MFLSLHGLGGAGTWVEFFNHEDMRDTRDRWAGSTSASKSSIQRFVITEKAPTRAFSWLKAGTTAFTFKTLLRYYAKQALTPRSLNVKLGPATQLS